MALGDQRKDSQWPGKGQRKDCVTVEHKEGFEGRSKWCELRGNVCILVGLRGGRESDVIVGRLVSGLPLSWVH